MNHCKHLETFVSKVNIDLDLLAHLHSKQHYINGAVRRS
jgi:hypothetical protein